VLAVTVPWGPQVRAAEPDNSPPSFFDAVASVSPGISREIDILLDHVRTSDVRLSQLSVRLQVPLLSWFQVALEVPALFRESGVDGTRAGAGDIVLGAQAMVWTQRDWPVEIDAGLELTLPTGSDSLLAGSTAMRPFVAAGVKVGPLDVIGNMSYQWLVAGPVARSGLFQSSLAVAYPLRWVAPFVELTIVKPMSGFEDPRPQVTMIPGIEIFLPWSLSLSAGVQVPVGPARPFDQRVLAFFKWPF